MDGDDTNQEAAATQGCPPLYNANSRRRWLRWTCKEVEGIDAPLDLTLRVARLLESTNNVSGFSSFSLTVDY